MASKIDHSKDLWDAIIGYATASSGLIMFGTDLLRALLLGVVGAIGGLFTKWFYYKYIRKDGNNNKKAN